MINITLPITWQYMLSA